MIMKCVSRLDAFKDEDFDRIFLKIRKGEIKCGKYAHLVKVDPNKKMKGKVFFQNENK